MENNMSVIQVNEERGFVDKAKKAMSLEHIREEYKKQKLRLMRVQRKIKK